MKGITVGIRSWKRRSRASTATAGAAAVRSRLPSLMLATSRALASGDCTNSTRSGCVLADVGAHRAISQTSRRSSSVTGRSL